MRIKMVKATLNLFDCKLTLATGCGSNIFISVVDHWRFNFHHFLQENKILIYICSQEPITSPAILLYLLDIENPFPSNLWSI